MIYVRALVHVHVDAREGVSVRVHLHVCTRVHLQLKRKNHEIGMLLKIIYSGTCLKESPLIDITVLPI